MADRYQGRPFPADDYDRGSDQHDSGGADPLAELARLIGQTDPFGTVGKSNPAAAPPVPRAAPRYEPQRYEDYPEEQVHQEGEQHADPSRYDDALYGQLQGGAQDYQREAAYPDDP